MKKTSVYLTDDEVEGLRRLSTDRGLSQSELIREAIRTILQVSAPRQFRSMGKGRSANNRPPEWTPDEVYDEVMGHR